MANEIPSTKNRKRFLKQQRKTTIALVDTELEEEQSEEVYGSEEELIKKIGFGLRFGGIAQAQDYVNKIVRNNEWQILSKGVTEVKLYFYNNKEFLKILKENHQQGPPSADVFALTVLTSDPKICAIGLKPNNRRALSHLIILHEMAHIAKAPFDHGPKFQRAYLSLLTKFLPNSSDKKKIITLLTEEFKQRELATKSFFTNGKVAGNREKLLLDEKKLKKKRSR